MAPNRELLDNEHFLADLQNLSLGSREVARRWNIGKTTVNAWRNRMAPAPTEVTAASVSAFKATKTVTEDSDGSRTVEAVRDRPVTLDDAREWIKSSGDNPDDYTLSIRSIAYGQDMFSNRMSATPKFKKSSTPVEQVDYQSLSSHIKGFSYIPPKKDFLVDLSVIQPTDNQLGKTDFDGGTPETIDRVLGSYANAVEYIKEYRPRQVMLAHTGDGIENFCNTSSQRDTNDLDLPHQISTMYQLDLQGLQMIAPHAQKLVSAYVPSNHSRWRVGQKADGGDPHADFGITNAKMLKSSLESFGVMPNVEIVWPESHMESMTVYFDTINIGLVHGHQASGPDKMGDWWARQDHGRMPTWDADVLFVGHWHSYRAYQSGDRRMVFVGPANEPGSSWYSNLKGERSTAGMLGVSFIEKKWMYQQLL